MKICIECKKEKVRSNNLCKNCYWRFWYRNRKRWSLKYEKCQSANCTSPKSRHKANGVCIGCYQKKKDLTKENGRPYLIGSNQARFIINYLARANYMNKNKEINQYSQRCFYCNTNGEMESHGAYRYHKRCYEICLFLISNIVNKEFAV